MSARPTALIAEDEPLLRDSLARQLAKAWPELDIVAWAVRAKTAQESSRRAGEIFAKAAQAGLHLALAELPAAFFGNPWGGGGTVTALRSVLMKPEHLSAVGTLYALLDRSAH